VHLTLRRALITSATILSTLSAAPALAGAAAPSDPLFAQQWSLRDNAVLGARSAWTRETGGPVTVAVIDSGVDVTHPDLRRNIWTNPGEIAGNGVDDDHDGLVDDVHGWNFVNDSDQIGDDAGHGTAVAGVIAAQGDNDRGVAGIAWRSKVMVLKVLDAHGNGGSLAVAQAVDYAVAHQARVINLSLGGPQGSGPLHDALVRASDAGILITVAAGNQGNDLDAQPEYPAAYPIPHLIAVAATGRDGRLLASSNYSRTHVALAAPGSRIATTVPGNAYGLVTGTSFAAPAAAAALVLLISARPDEDADALQSTLLSSARGTSMPVADGTLDIGAALRRATRITAG
jgi:subtilisin family serine protease